MRDEIQLLVDNADAARQRVARALDVGERAVHANLAGVLAVGAAQDLNERGLAGAVLAEQHVHFAGAQRQLHAVERYDTRKTLPDATHLKDRR